MTKILQYDIQVSSCGKTLWVHAQDGSTVGRFSKIFGMDVHTTASEQLDGKPQCLHCTYAKPSYADWLEFCELMLRHYQISLEKSLVTFT